MSRGKSMEDEASSVVTSESNYPTLENCIQTGLVIKPTIHGQFSPGKLEAGLHPSHCPLKALNPAPSLWCEPDRLAEDLREAPFAPSRLLRHMRNLRHCGRLFELAQSKLDCRMHQRNAYASCAARS